MNRATKLQRQLLSPGVLLGCDPEFFFARKGQVVGSESVIPAEIVCSTGKIIQDGVQVELNPSPSSCRQTLASNIIAAMGTLQTQMGSTTKLLDSGVVEVPKSVMDGLSSKSKVLGCAPSLNTYDTTATVKVGEDYRVRSAGGHIHLGLKGSAAIFSPSLYPRIVPILDILCGAIGVLLDRDPAQVERRKVYGRAGEYRLPSHGLEYRVLSNFWMRHYVLYSLMLAQARNAVSVVFTQQLTTASQWNAEKELLALHDLARVRAAINQNDADLAWECWEQTKKWLAMVTYTISGLFSSEGYSNIEEFEWLAREIQAHGIASVFPLDPMTAWLTTGTSTGWENYALHTLKPRILRAKNVVAAAAAQATIMKGAIS